MVLHSPQRGERRERESMTPHIASVMTWYSVCCLFFTIYKCHSVMTFVVPSFDIRRATSRRVTSVNC